MARVQYKPTARRIACVPRDWKTRLKKQGETRYIVYRERLAEVRVAPWDGGFILLHPGFRVFVRKRRSATPRPVWMTASQLRVLGVRQTHKLALKAGIARVRQIRQLFERRVAALQKAQEKLESQLTKAWRCIKPKQKRRSK